MKVPGSTLSGSPTIGCLVVRVLNDLNILTVVIKSFVKRTWSRAPPRIRGILSGGATPGTLRTACLSPAARLPLEIVKMIIFYLIYDTASLLACSLTCCSWHIAAVPHIHHTLIVTIFPFGTNEDSVWPKPLRAMHKSGLLPLVKKFHVNGSPRNFWQPNGFSPQKLSCRAMHHFLELTNVQELGIAYLNIPKFMPRIRRYFRHFLPTVRSLALRAPKGSR